MCSARRDAHDREKPSDLALADGTVDLVRARVHRGDRAIPLTTKELGLLEYLAARPGEAVSREELLGRVWGYHAKVVSRALDTTMRRLRKKIEVDDSHPAQLVTVHGVGYRFVPLAPPPPTPSAPSPPADGFVGREVEIADVERLLADGGCRVVTVVGPPGVGKTRLALELGRASRERFAGGAWACDLLHARSADDVAGAVGRALSSPLTRGEALTHAAAVLAEKGRALVVLDNADRAVEATATAVATWSRTAPRVCFLVTSRERLRVAGERVFELGPLSPAAACALFLDRSAAARADVPSADLVARIVARLDHLPLAIELAAARMRVLSPADLLARLDAPLQVLSRGSRAAPGRSSSLRGALDDSWELLDDDERAALAQCSVFRAGFTVDAAEKVIALPAGSSAWVVDVLDALRDKSLLVPAPGAPAGTVRLSLADSVREYAAEKVEELGLREAAHGRHLHAYLALGQSLVEALDGPRSADAMARLAAERENLLAAWRRAERSAPALALRVVVLLDQLLAAHGPLETQERLLDAAVALASAAAADRSGPAAKLPLELRAEVLRLRGESRRIRGDRPGALADLVQALELSRAASHRRTEAFTLGSLAFLHWVGGAIADAETHVRAALAIHERRGDRVQQSLMWMSLGVLSKHRGDFEGAAFYHRRALTMQRAAGARRYEGLTLSNLANLCRERGELAQAEAHYREAVAVHRELGHLRWQAGALHNLGALRCLRGDPQGAEGITREALEVARRGGDAASIGHILHSLGYLLHFQRRFDEAEAAYAESIERLRAVDDALAGSAIGDLAALEADRDRPEAAEALFARAEQALSGPAGAGHEGALAIHKAHLRAARARRARHQGDHAAADALLAEAHRTLGEADPEAPQTRARMAAHLLRASLAGSTALSASSRGGTETDREEESGASGAVPGPSSPDPDPAP